MMEKIRCQSCFQEYVGTRCPHCGHPDIRNESHQLSIGTTLRGRYQIGKVLGQGGFGITYLAWDRLMQATVAVKEFFPDGMVYRKDMGATRVECVTERAVPHFEYSRERFLREASALVKFKDLPEIVDILDFVEENNTTYIVMEYVRGVDLAKYIQRNGGKLTAEETFRILRPVMEALAKVHKSGIIHRDISPDNIILDPMGGAKLLDFGAVRTVEDPDVEKGLNKSTEAILKQGFAPIEQYNTRGSLGPWTDEYALCATIWYCLTGTLPEDASIRMSDGIDPDWSSIPGLPEYQQAALAKGFSCRAKDRYMSVDELLAALFPAGASVSRPVPVQAPVFVPVYQPAPIPEPAPKAAAPAPRAGKKSRGKGKLFLGIGLGAAAIAAAAVILILAAPTIKYNAASSLLAKGRYEEAIAKFSELGTYSDSRSRIKECNYAWAEQLLEDGSYQEAAEKFSDLKNYEDSRDMAMECHYCWAEDLLEQGRVQEAIDKFTQLGNYSDSAARILDCHYAQAEALLAEGRNWEAAAAFGKLSGHRDARERSIALWTELFRVDTISGGEDHTLAIRTDGTVAAVGANGDRQCNVGSWSEIISVSAGDKYSIGLKSDGTVVAAGLNDYEQCNVQGWSDIVAVSAGYRHTLGLKSDGTVVVTGSNATTDKYVGTRFDAAMWTDIIAIGAGGGHSVGLKSDGTVVAAGYNEYDQCDVGGWTDIVAISVGVWHTVGLKSDGTVVVAGSGTHCDVDGWTDIIAISAGKNHTVGLKLDGTVVSAGTGTQCDVSDWTDIVAISTGELHTVGLKSDGTLIAVGDNDSGQCDVRSWAGIRTPVTYD